MHQSTDKVQVSNPRRIIWNTVYSTFSELSLLFTSVFFILAARRLGDFGFGQFTTALAFVGLFSILVIFGFSYSITKVIVRDRHRAGAFVSNALALQGGLTLVCLAACLGTALAFPGRYDPAFRRLLLIVVAAESVKAYTLTLRSAIKALGHFRSDTMAVNAERVFLLVIGGGLLIAGYGVAVAAWVLALSRLISFYILLTAVRRRCPDGLRRPSLPMSKTLLWQSWVYVMQAALWRVYDYIDTVMISLLGGFQQAGWYTAGKKILEGLWLVPNILTEALYPEINARVHVSKDLAASLFRRGMKYLAVAAVAAAGATVLLSGPLVEIIYGSRFAKTVDVLRVLGLAVVPSYLRYMFGNTLIAVNLQNWETVMAGVRGVVNVTANYLLIPSYGAVGAAIAFLVTDLITVVFYLWILHGANLVDRGLLLQLGKPIADALVLVPIYGLMSRLHPLVQSMALLPLYAVVLFLFRTFDKQEIDVFRKMLAEQMHKFSGHSKVANG